MLQVRCFVHIFESVNQDWFTVASIVENTLSELKVMKPHFEEVYLRSDNAGCYHSAPLILSMVPIGQRVGIKIRQYDFSEPQRGKDICDRKVAVLKGHIRRFINEGNNVQSASDMKAALDSYGGVKGCACAVVDIDETKRPVTKLTWPGIQALNNFLFEDDEGIRVWKSFNIGEGKVFHPSCNDGETNLKVIDDFDFEPQQEEPPQKKQKTSPAPVSNRETPAVFACPEANCIKEFQSFADLEQHMDSGRHLLKPLEEKVSDAIKCRWAKVCTDLQSKHLPTDRPMASYTAMSSTTSSAMRK